MTNKMRKQLSKKEIKELAEDIETKIGLTDVISKKDNVIMEDDTIVVNGTIRFFYKANRIIPTLKFIISLGDVFSDKFRSANLKTITVDKGAIKFVVNGADIMRPGITKIDDGIDNDDFVIIIDEEHRKPLAIGISLLDSEELKAAKEGKVIKNIHYVGDDVWKKC
ncbi:MAG: PUA domain-containing protein [Candidatus Woesearchaeota archaeon]